MGRRDVLLLSILTVVTSLGWVLFDFYHATVDSTIPENVEAELAPITPKFDRELIDKLKTRRDVEPLVEEDIIKLPTAGRVATPPVATVTATPPAGL